MEVIYAQALYDHRERHAQISGMDLHHLFMRLVGEMSPAGRTRISVEALIREARATLDPNEAQFIQDVLNA